MFVEQKKFPSPTGVNHYELFVNYQTFVQKDENGFRPQQGLTIMNLRDLINSGRAVLSFRPQQGLTIMNMAKSSTKRKLKLESFRPQQGLTIMNWK